MYIRLLEAVSESSKDISTFAAAVTYFEIEESVLALLEPEVSETLKEVLGGGKLEGYLREYRQDHSPIYFSKLQERETAILQEKNVFAKLNEKIGEMLEENGINRQAWKGFDNRETGDGLKNKLQPYMENLKIMEKIAEEGLSYEEINSLGEERLEEILGSCLEEYADTFTGLEVGGTIEIPIGPNAVLYYGVAGDGDTDSGISISYVTDMHMKELKGLDVTKELFGGISAGAGTDGPSVGVSDGIGRELVYGAGGKISYEYEYTQGDNTYGYKYELDLIEKGITLEESITTAVGAGSITSTAGIRASDDMKTKWKPVQFDPVTSDIYETWEAPAFDIGWEEIGISAGVATSVVTILYIGKKILGIVLAPSTGGASLFLTAT